MVSLPIDFVSHPKIPFSLRSETSETGGSVSLFHEKKFRYVLLQFRFEAKFGDTLVSPKMNSFQRKRFRHNCIFAKISLDSHDVLRFIGLFMEIFISVCIFY